jgi:hypothetical protein
MKITKKQLKQIIKEELKEGFLDKLTGRNSPEEPEDSPPTYTPPSNTVDELRDLPEQSQYAYLSRAPHRMLIELASELKIDIIQLIQDKLKNGPAT